MKHLVSLFLLVLAPCIIRAANHTVTFKDNVFEPANLTINAGDTVIFKHMEGFHTVTGVRATDAFCGNNMVADQCSVKFDTAGSYPYRCLFHSTAGPTPTGMVGNITVLQATAEKPNLVPFRLNGWSSSLVLSREPGDNISDPDFADDQDVFLDWAIANISLTAGITQKFFTEVLIDGVSKGSWFHDGLTPDTFNKIEDFNLGKLPLGDHTVRLVTDHTSVVDESNENDNTFESTFRVFPSTANKAVVLVSDFRFNPPLLTIAKGTTVDFQNLSGTHTVTGAGADPFCGQNAIQNSCSVTFNVLGRFPYRCIFHSSSATQGMVGEVVVVDQVRAESATAIGGTFRAASGALVNYTDRTVSFPRPNVATYWRLNSTTALRITNVKLDGGRVVLSYGN